MKIKCQLDTTKVMLTSTQELCDKNKYTYIHIYTVYTHTHIYIFQHNI